MTSESVKELYAQLKLFRGAIAEMSMLLGVTQQAVRKAMRDEAWENKKYIETAKDVLKRRKAEVMAKVA